MQLALDHNLKSSIIKLNSDISYLVSLLLNVFFIANFKISKFISFIFSVSVMVLALRLWR